LLYKNVVPVNCCSLHRRIRQKIDMQVELNVDKIKKLHVSGDVPIQNCGTLEGLIDE
jgi:hypothetical protein